MVRLHNQYRTRDQPALLYRVAAHLLPDPHRAVDVYAFVAVNASLAFEIGQSKWKWIFKPTYVE